MVIEKVAVTKVVAGLSIVDATVRLCTFPCPPMRILDFGPFAKKEKRKGANSSRGKKTVPVGLTAVVGQEML